MAARRKLDEILKKLKESGIEEESHVRLKNDKGWRIDCTNGAIVNVYDTGKVTIQGKSGDIVSGFLGMAKIKDIPKADTMKTEQKIFVVYGHAMDLRHELEATLRRWGLYPLILDELPSGGTTIIEKLEKYATEDVLYAVVLATPDDEGREFKSKDTPRPRVRQNIVLELGMLLAKLGRKRVAIALKNVENMERPSDIDGLIYLPFTKSLAEIKSDLAKEMNNQGIQIDWSNL